MTEPASAAEGLDAAFGAGSNQVLDGLAAG